jgi:hypothetical protein
MSNDPTKKPSRSRDNRVVVLLSDEEKAAFEAAVEPLDITVANWLRLLGRKSAGLPTI